MKTQFVKGLGSILLWTMSLEAQTPQSDSPQKSAPPPPTTRVEAVYATDPDTQHRFSSAIENATGDLGRLNTQAAQSAADYFLADPADGSRDKSSDKSSDKSRMSSPGVVKTMCFACHGDASRRQGSDTEYRLSYAYPGKDGKLMGIDRVVNFPKLDTFLTTTLKSLPDFLKIFRASELGAKREYVMLVLGTLHRLKRDVGRLAADFGAGYDASRDWKHFAALETFFIDSGIVSRQTLATYYALDVPVPTSFHDLPVHLAVRLQQGAKVDALKEKFSSAFADLGLSETQITDLFVRSRSLKMLPDKN